jgi:hypothetical protein
MVPHSGDIRVRHSEHRLATRSPHEPTLDGQTR